MKNQKSILLVDDDKDDQLFFIEALNEIENATLFDIANNGQEALDKLENSAILPDIIFMDINMPVMNGINCLTEILKKPGIKDIPVVFLTADADKIDTVRQLGAKGFIKKPDNNKTLRCQLEEMIRPDFITGSNIINQTHQPFFQHFKLS